MIEVVEPATEQVMAELPRAGAEEADAAVARAKEAFPAGARWRRATAPRSCTASPTRSSERADDLATLEARNAGKPIARRPRRDGDGRARRSATTPARRSACWARRSRSPAAST